MIEVKLVVHEEYDEVRVLVHSAEEDLSPEDQRRRPMSFDEEGFVTFYERLFPLYDMLCNQETGRLGLKQDEKTDAVGFRQ